MIKFLNWIVNSLSASKSLPFVFGSLSNTWMQMTIQIKSRKCVHAYMRACEKCNKGNRNSFTIKPDWFNSLHFKKRPDIELNFWCNGTHTVVVTAIMQWHLEPFFFFQEFLSMMLLPGQFISPKENYELFSKVFYGVTKECDSTPSWSHS